MDTATPRRRVNAPSHAKRKRKPPRTVSFALPPPPAELGASAAKEWKRIAPGLLLLGADFVLDRALILNYVESVGDLADVRADWRLCGAPSVVIRPAGERPHPDIETIRRLAADVARYADRLGLSARSRKILDISIGPVAPEPEPTVAGKSRRTDDPAARFFLDD